MDPLDLFRLVKALPLCRRMSKLLEHEGLVQIHMRSFPSRTCLNQDLCGPFGLVTSHQNIAYWRTHVEAGTACRACMNIRASSSLLGVARIAMLSIVDSLDEVLRRPCGAICHAAICHEEPISPGPHRHLPTCSTIMEVVCLLWVSTTETSLHWTTSRACKFG
jgi:hypothetical protein